MSATRLHSLSELSCLFGGPDAQTSATKIPATAEAARGGGFAMLNVAQEHAGAEAPRREVAERVPVAAAQSQARFLREGFVRLTAEQAGEILGECRYARQDRDVKLGGRNQIATLADIMKRGQWRSKDQLDFALLSGVMILLNGHHRLAAQSLSGKTIEWSIVIHRCASSDDIERLFYSFDTNVRIRSNQNILAAADAARVLGLMHTTVEALYRATPVLVANFDFTRTARDPLVTRIVDRRMEVMKSYQKEAADWEAACKKAPTPIKKRLLNQGAFAVAMAAFRHRPLEAHGFWNGTSENDGLRKGDPRNTYLASLSSPNNLPTSHYTAKQIANAWNAYFEGRKLSYIRVDIAAQFRIAGTPIGR